MQVPSTGTGIYHYIMKILYEVNLKHACYLLHSTCMLKKVPCITSAAFADNTPKCYLLITGEQHLVQMLTIALTAMNSGGTEPVRLWIFRIEACRASNAYSRSMSFLAHPARSLLANSTNSEALPFHQSMGDAIRRRAHSTLRIFRRFPTFRTLFDLTFRLSA